MHLLAILLSLVFSTSSYAIVIRHDIPDEQYLASMDDFKPLATFYIDGAHGTLIHPKWVITAAHATFCIQPKSKILINKQHIRVKNLYVHKDYQPGSHNDVALIELSHEINDITPAKVYKGNDEVGQNIWFIGIGGTGTGLTGQTIDNFENNGVLRKAQNTVIKAEGPLLKFTFNQTNDALPLEGVSGGGDSGGPAFKTIKNELFLLGISSRFEDSALGSGIGKYGITEIYSRVSYLSPWINQIIHGDKATQNELSTPKLLSLPVGLSEEILPAVCQDIAL